MIIANIETFQLRIPSKSGTEAAASAWGEGLAGRGLVTRQGDNRPGTRRLLTGKKEISMSLKPKRNGSTELQATSTQVEAGVSVKNSVRDEETRHRAYEIYLERGQQPGRELDDWLQAQRELEARTLSRAQAG